MPVFRWGQDWNAFRDLEREVDRLFRSMHLTFHGLRAGRQFPAVNVYQLEQEYLLTAEIPGTKAEDLELTLSGGILTIKGRRTDLDDVPEERVRRNERFRGAWQRQISIPERVKEDELRAEFTNGVLAVHLPKADEIRARQIPVVEGS
jgi:HSP20 family protein